MKSLLTLVLLLLGSLWLRAQDVILLPHGLNFSPLRTNLEEPRIGLVKSIDAGDMRVDVGNTVDLFGVRGERLVVTAGIDFFAYALVTGSEGLRLQIDAIDGFFGGNISASAPGAAGRWSARLRLLHHSAHLVDSRAREAIPYTQDFGELVVALEPSATVRCYGGFSYATLVRPADIERLAYLAGIEAADDGIVGPVGGEPLNLFVSYTASLDGTPAYAATHTVQAGAKLGRFFDKGAALFVEWYSGRHMLAEYFDERMSFVGVGFSVDFF